MILYTVNDKIFYQTRSDKPNEDWTGKAEFIVDETNPENEELISKIKLYAPYMAYVTDSGVLIDVEKTGDKPVPEEPATAEERISQLEDENRYLNAKVTALTESTSMLEECIVEMAEIVYA